MKYLLRWYRWRVLDRPQIGDYWVDGVLLKDRWAQDMFNWRANKPRR